MLVSSRRLSTAKTFALCTAFCLQATILLAIPPVFEIDQGYLNGFTAARTDGDTPAVLGFTGIPYAQPPVGDLRWRPPQPPSRFDALGPFEAIETPASCLQPPYPAESFYPPVQGEFSEDCLYLNVWTAAESPAERRPVMVWIHGGALTRGSGSNPVYDGTALAKKGAVVVTINYRLGVFGYLAHPALTAESRQFVGEGGQRGASGNYGVLDQVAALQWVRNNISAFGGDPDNVTIFGESAGSWSVNALQATPLAKGLFHRAIGQSGGVFRAMPKLRGDAEDSNTGHAAGLAFAKRLGVETEDPSSEEALTELRALPAERVLEVASGRGAFSTEGIVDGWVFPSEIRDLFANGRQSNVPVLLGSNADEMTSLTGRLRPNNISMLRTILATQRGDAADEVLAAYDADQDSEAESAFLAILRDELFTRQMRLWARAMESVDSEAYLYYFTRSPMHPERETYGAYHAAEIAYAFDNIETLPYQHEDIDRRLEDQLSTLWFHFARDGKPSAPGIPEWPPYSAGERYMELGDEVRIGSGLCQKQCDVLDRLSAP